MPRLLVFSDIHNDSRALEKLMAIEADYYFAAGDLVSWARGLDKMGEVMKRRAGKIYVLPGNHESAADIASFCQRFGFSDFHGGTLEIAGVHVVGWAIRLRPLSTLPANAAKRRWARGWTSSAR